MSRVTHKHVRVGGYSICVWAGLVCPASFALVRVYTAPTGIILQFIGESVTGGGVKGVCTAGCADVRGTFLMVVRSVPFGG